MGVGIVYLLHSLKVVGAVETARQDDEARSVMMVVMAMELLASVSPASQVVQFHP